MAGISKNASTPVPVTKEKTFSAYDQAQAKKYAQLRRDYHASLYETVLQLHKSTGGQSNTIVDLGCGPGNVGRTLSANFDHVFGLDPSEGMIAMARSLGGMTSNSEQIRFERSTAEDIGSSLSPPIADGSVDLITAANAAHWFDMAGFWPRAAQVLKPGGSVALWCSGRITVHDSVPNAKAIQTTFDQYEEEELLPYMEPGNLLTRNRYVDLPLPWTLEQPTAAFDQSTFVRKEWDPVDDFFAGDQVGDLETFEKMVGTGSAVTRWREAHPDAVGTENDVVRKLRRDIERLLHDAGVEPGEEKVKGAVLGVLLVVKKKA